MKALIAVFKSPLLYIFITALVLRTIYLSDIPGGFHVDEVKAGWNAYSILITGMDDWGSFYPLYYDSFGDYRPTGIIYSIIPSILIFGVNEFAVRFPSSLFGALTIFPLFYLVTAFLKNKLSKKDAYLIAYLSAGSLALSPWHISLSRATSEGIIALFLALTGLTFLSCALSNQNLSKSKSILFYILSFLFFITSYFFYHNTRLLIPVMALVAFVILSGIGLKFSKENLQILFSKKPAVILLILLCLATLIFASQKEARGRFSQVSIFSNLDIKRDLDKFPFELGPGRVLEARIFFNKPLSYGRRFFEEYARYFSSDFFVVYGSAKPVRYQIAGMGIITYVEFALIFFGLIALGKYRLSLLPIALLLISPLPAALTTEDAPNLHRAIFMIPFLSILISYGLYYLFRLNTTRKYLLPAFFALFAFNFAFFLHMYLIHNPVHEPIPLYRNAAAKQLALKIDELNDKFDKLIVTNIPDSIYPWLAFYTMEDPAIFNKIALTRQKGVWSYKNIEFSAQRCPSRDAYKYQTSENVLVIDAEGCNGNDVKYPPYLKIYGEIKRPDGAVTYTLWAEDKEMRKLYPELEPKESSESKEL